MALVAANAFFVAIEFALLAVDRHRVESDAEDGSRSAGATLGLLRRLSSSLSTAQVGITVSSLVLGFVAEPAVAALIEPLLNVSDGVGIALALAIATVSQMVFGELIPKSIAVSRPMETCTALSLPMRFVDLASRPLVAYFNGSANWTVRRLGIEPTEELASSRSIEELQFVIKESAELGTLDIMVGTRLDRSIRFGAKTAGDVVVPRTSVTALEADDTVVDLIEAATRTGHSRFPVYEDDIDHVIGVVHAKDALGLAGPDRAQRPVRSIMRPVLAVPESRPLEDLLVDFRREHGYLAIVVDEYGGTEGIVTVEDLVEEIVGEIDDEHDTPTPERNRSVLAAGAYELPGAARRDEVYDEIGFRLPDGPFDTLAGFVIDRLGLVPRGGERFEYDGWELEVTGMDRRRVERVRIVEPEPAVPSAGSDTR